MESAEVSWESGRAEVFGSAEGAALVEAVECTGKDAVLLAPPTRLVLKVDGMMCGNCEGKVKNALRATPPLLTLPGLACDPPSILAPRY